MNKNALAKIDDLTLDLEVIFGNSENAGELELPLRLWDLPWFIHILESALKYSLKSMTCQHLCLPSSSDSSANGGLGS